MKLEKLRNVQALAKQRIGQHVSGFHVWLACTLCAVLLATSLANRLLVSSEYHARIAMENGQRVVYHLANGEVDGTPRHTKKQAELQDPLFAPVAGKGGAVIDETFAGKEGLAAAPLDTITEQTDKGLVPTAGKDGTLPWKYYARPHTAKESKPMVAIVFTNLGLSKPLTAEVLKVPHTVTLSFSPYASDAKSWARRARGEGYESLIDLPMEPSNFPISDPGPYGLLNSLDAAEISSRMHWTLSRYPGFVGALGGADEKMTTNLSAMRTILTELTARGVLFVYKKSPQNTELAELIKKQNLLAIGAEAVIDNDLTPAAIVKQLNALTTQAKTQGYAIGIAHSYPSTLKALEIWMEAADAAGVEVVPVSAIGRKLFP